MNLDSPLRMPLKFLFAVTTACRRLLPKTRCYAFGRSHEKTQPKIEHIYVINLNRETARWVEMKQELRHVLDCSGSELWNLTERYAAIDAKEFAQEPLRDSEVDPVYTLGDQLFVEPQPLTLPTRLELTSPIRMSRPEVAVARSHINIWRQVAAGKHDYALILEDDVWFQSDFSSRLNEAWHEIMSKREEMGDFDILYLSYAEVKYGAPKTFLSANVYRPMRGLWHLSGYVVSRPGAKKLLRLLPCRGPIDLWINHLFKVLDVRATRRSIISQRRDTASSNAYSILPALTRIGAINSESASLFHSRPTEGPVFAFGPTGSGLTSLAMALSMLGYRCCSDLEDLPGPEFENLFLEKKDRIFDAYVNIRSLAGKVRELKQRYSHGKFIITTGDSPIGDSCDLQMCCELNGDFAILHSRASNKWQVVCEHLRCAPPACAFPDLADLGQRQLLDGDAKMCRTPHCKTPERDKSPWVVEPRPWWQGIRLCPSTSDTSTAPTLVRIKDDFESLDTEHWCVREDTFTDNLALFRASNIKFVSGVGAAFSVRRESLGVRQYSAAALTSRGRYLFGRFEAVFKPAKTPGVITGFFLHRDSPRQEIDIEITGNRSDRLLVNVFYNPGDEGAKFDYGYRGASSYIDLGFDASESFHRFAIEWEPSEIRWFVDGHLVHRRAEWEPTPIPHLPMALHLNAWPTRSKELAGRLASRGLPSTSIVKSVVLEANLAGSKGSRGLLGAVAEHSQRHVGLCRIDP